MSILRLDDPGRTIRSLWDRLSSLPGGKALFSKMVGQAAPYTGSMGAKVERVERGKAIVKLSDRRPVRNHLSSIHAVALVNLAELTGNIALTYSLPSNARFIVTSIGIEYLKKARGTITAQSECPVPDTNERKEYEVPVELKNAAGELVAKATLRSLVGPISS